MTAGALAAHPGTFDSPSAVAQSSAHNSVRSDVARAALLVLSQLFRHAHTAPPRSFLGPARIDVRTSNAFALPFHANTAGKEEDRTRRSPSLKPWSTGLVVMVVVVSTSGLRAPLARRTQAASLAAIGTSPPLRIQVALGCCAGPWSQKLRGIRQAGFHRCGHDYLY